MVLRLRGATRPATIRVQRRLPSSVYHGVSLSSRVHVRALQAEPDAATANVSKDDAVTLADTAPADVTPVDTVQLADDSDAVVKAPDTPPPAAAAPVPEDPAAPPASADADAAGAAGTSSSPEAPSTDVASTSSSVVEPNESASRASSQAASSEAPTPSRASSDRPAKFSARNPERKRAGPGEAINAADFPYRQGDVIVGKVRWANNRGARVDIEGFSAVQGYMPRNRGPIAIRDGTERNRFADTHMGVRPCMPKGCVRKFLVSFVPDDMHINGKGPILVCDVIDREVLVTRVRQVAEIGRKMRETIRVPVHGAVDRGLLCTFSGIRGFIPSSHIPKPRGTWLAADDLKAKYVGKDVEVALMRVDGQRPSFVGSINNANSDRTLRQLAIGSLVWGTVRKITSYGAFVSLDGTYESALLHIANISWHRVEAVEDVFEEGERVRAVVIGMDEGFTRLSVSTRDLEGTEGDMLASKEAVFADADTNVKRFLEHVAKWEADTAAKEAEEAAAAA